MKRGFSLIELLVVVAIIAILVGVAAPYYNDYVKESKRTKALQDIDVLKQAVLLHDSQEDLPYIGLLATDTSSVGARVPILGENDFIGLQGKYLTNIPTDPWDKNYKLDPYGCFIYSEGPDSSTLEDDVKDYYIKDLALVSVEWTDLNNDRVINQNDKLYFTFNKCLYIANGGMSPSDYEIFVNGISTNTAQLAFTQDTILNEDNASTTVIIATVGAGSTVKLGVHSVSVVEDDNIRQKYQEVWVDRDLTLANFSAEKKVYTRVEKVDGTRPLRYIMRSNPVKIKEKK